MTTVTFTEVARQNTEQPSWKRPGLRLSTKGVSLSETILAERNKRNKQQLKAAKKAGLKTQPA